MRRLVVNLPGEPRDRSYPILIGPGLLGETDTLRSWVNGREVFIITNTTVAPLYLQRIEAAFADYRLGTLVLPDGESHKRLGTLEHIIGALLEQRFSRSTTLLALGGGVIGDMTGFAAACYQRGVDFVQIPTTLLAQVDSSIGGKTAVNHALGKNMIGAFYQPRGVLIDTDVLATLPGRELAAGLAEVIKYGCIRDPAFFAWLEVNMEAILAGDAAALSHAIMRSCETKAEVVALDERESGLRAILNYGHTFGHAIETHTGYRSWLHGEAVAVGMVIAAELSVMLGTLSAEDAARIQALVRSAGLPVAPPPDLGVPAFLDHMSVDKKVVDGRSRLVVLDGLGAAVVRDDIDPDMIATTLHAAGAPRE